MSANTPYTVRDNGCEHCGSSHTWTIVGPAGEFTKRFHSRGEAQDYATDLNEAFYLGSNTPRAATAPVTVRSIREGLRQAEAAGEDTSLVLLCGDVRMFVDEIEEAEGIGAVHFSTLLQFIAREEDADEPWEYNSALEAVALHSLGLMTDGEVRPLGGKESE